MWAPYFTRILQVWTNKSATYIGWTVWPGQCRPETACIKKPNQLLRFGTLGMYVVWPREIWGDLDSEILVCIIILSLRCCCQVVDEDEVVVCVSWILPFAYISLGWKPSNLLMTSYILDSRHSARRCSHVGSEYLCITTHHQRRVPSLFHGKVEDVTGCLYTEETVEGPRPNLAEPLI